MSTADNAAEQPTRTRRLSLSDITRQLLERGGSEHSSVTLTRNAKGETQIEVVVRTGEHGAVTTVLEAEQVAGEVYDRLRGKYPPSTAAGAGNGSAGSGGAA